MAEYRCMIVEDSPTVRHLVVATLRRIPQLQIVEAADGVDALQKLPGLKVDLLLTGGAMPVMGGHRLTSLLQENPLYREIPVVLLADEEPAADRSGGLPPGVRARVAKPIRGSQLLEVVRGVLGLSPGRQDGAIGRGGA